LRIITPLARLRFWQQLSQRFKPFGTWECWFVVFLYLSLPVFLVQPALHSKSSVYTLFHHL
jgi:hypothetical protein